MPLATTKIWPVRDSLHRVVDYAANPDKTEYSGLAQALHYAGNDAKTRPAPPDMDGEQVLLVSGIHCRAGQAWADMRAVQRRFGKTGGTVALHAYQSFRPGEVTPRQCHDIGVELARRVWGGRFQVLVATHIDTDHLHSHLIVNSVSFQDGKKLHQSAADLQAHRLASDEICAAHGLEVLPPPQKQVKQKRMGTREYRSAAKGESVADTIRVVGCYADIIAMRHPKEGAPLVASGVSTVPIINAGDGGHNHPTQTLTDLMTIRREKGSLSGFTIGLCGDLKFGRTVHSLISALARYDNVRFVLISPEELKLPSYVKNDVLRAGNREFKQTAADLADVIPQLDVLYMTRVQRERFFNEEDYIRLRDSYILTPSKLANAKSDLTILHPLPRVNEISVDVDDDPRAVYFQQAQFGVYVRMALILTLLDIHVD